MIKERNRCGRSGSPLSNVNIDLSAYSEKISLASEETYMLFLETLVKVINDDTRNYDIKSIEDPYCLRILLVDTAAEGAKKFIEKISKHLFGRFEGMGKKELIKMIRTIQISTFPVNKVEEAKHVEGSPTIINKVVFGTTESTEKKTIVSAQSQIFEKNEDLSINWDLKVGSNGAITIEDVDFWGVFYVEQKDLFYRFFKRMVDFFGSLFGILMFGPVMLVIALAIKLSSRGPVLFKQERVGLLGKPFMFMKFRSMRSDSDSSIHQEYVTKLIKGETEGMNKGSDEKPMFKIVDDPRVTKIGKFIRKTSLDELPQFFNVLFGQMSLVGPRPPIAYEVREYQNWHLRRILDIKPGITGLWQAYGRSQTTFDEMVRLDLQYVSHCSPWLDIKILFKTVTAVFAKEGAY